MDKPSEYWQEAVENALDEMGLFHMVEAMTVAQRAALGQSLQTSQECYGMAFYSPPDSDRISSLERAHQAEVAALKADKEKYMATAERVVGRLLNQWPDARLSIQENGEVIRFGGRIERIA